jgi:carboxyl-terminal processing protease
MSGIEVEKAALLGLALGMSFLSGYLLNINLPWAEEDAPTALLSSRMEGGAIKRYTEALGYIEEHSMFPTPVESPQEIVAASLKAYLSQKDPYSDFLSPEELVKFRAAGSQRSGGIGLDIQKQRDGSVFCYPLPNGPAASGGIRPGNRLLAIDGTSVAEKSLPAIVALASGEAGTDVVIEYVSNSGIKTRVTLTRSVKSAPAVSAYTFRSARIISLPYFTPNTRRELLSLLSNWSKNEPIIIDLRNCGGGDFHAAVDSAMLFLSHGDPIVSVNRRSGTESYVSTLSQRHIEQPVFLWQDGFTASAGEIFISALTDNGRAISAGKTTAGKGTRQDIIELQSGGALILTMGYLITPNKVRFDGKGLLPMRWVEADAGDTRAFFDKTDFDEQGVMN